MKFKKNSRVYPVRSLAHKTYDGVEYIEWRVEREYICEEGYIDKKGIKRYKPADECRFSYEEADLFETYDEARDFVLKKDRVVGYKPMLKRRNDIIAALATLKLAIEKLEETKFLFAKNPDEVKRKTVLKELDDIESFLLY